MEQSAISPPTMCQSINVVEAVVSCAPPSPAKDPVKSSKLAFDTTFPNALVVPQSISATMGDRPRAFISFFSYQSRVERTPMENQFDRMNARDHRYNCRLK
jgi:hypothetical protein